MACRGPSRHTWRPGSGKASGKFGSSGIAAKYECPHLFDPICHPDRPSLPHFPQGTQVTRPRGGPEMARIRIEERRFAAHLLSTVPDAVLSFVTPVAQDAWDSDLRSEMVIRLLVCSCPGISQVGETFPSRSLAPHTPHSLSNV